MDTPPSLSPQQLQVAAPRRRAVAAELRAAFGPGAFPELRRACERYRSGELDAPSFCALFYGLIAEGDGSLVRRADVMLEQLCELLPPPRRAALRDPGLRGRARLEVSRGRQQCDTSDSRRHGSSGSCRRVALAPAHDEEAGSGAGQQPAALTITVRALRCPPVQLSELARSETIGQLKARMLSDVRLAGALQGCVAAADVRLLRAGVALGDSELLGSCCSSGGGGGGGVAAAPVLHVLAARKPLPTSVPASTSVDDVVSCTPAAAPRASMPSCNMVCEECARTCPTVGGRVDDADGFWYCNRCWDAFEQPLSAQTTSAEAGAKAEAQKNIRPAAAAQIESDHQLAVALAEADAEDAAADAEAAAHSHADSLRLARQMQLAADEEPAILSDAPRGSEEEEEEALGRRRADSQSYGARWPRNRPGHDASSTAAPPPRQPVWSHDLVAQLEADVAEGATGGAGGQQDTAAVLIEARGSRERRAAALADDIAAARFETGWSGCPESFSLAVSGVGDSELAVRVREVVGAIAQARGEQFDAEFGAILARRRAGSVGGCCCGCGCCGCGCVLWLDLD
jgi:hypothetical protein